MFSHCRSLWIAPVQSANLCHCPLLPIEGDKRVVALSDVHGGKWLALRTDPCERRTRRDRGEAIPARAPEEIGEAAAVGMARHKDALGVAAQLRCVGRKHRIEELEISVAEHSRDRLPTRASSVWISQGSRRFQSLRVDEDRFRPMPLGVIGTSYLRGVPAVSMKDEDDGGAHAHRRLGGKRDQCLALRRVDRPRSARG